MFPDAKHTPAHCPQLTVHLSVPCLVRIQLGGPERAVALGSRGVLGTAVPEAAIPDPGGRHRKGLLGELAATGAHGASPAKESVVPCYAAPALGQLRSHWL